MSNADEILKKHEDANEMHFHEVDRKWLIEAMEEYAREKSEKPINLEMSDEEIMDAAYKYAEVYQCPTEIKMCKHDVISAWNKAIEWYIEQLKQRQ